MQKEHKPAYIIPFAKSKDDCKPVSYTHLDVYKRQDRYDIVLDFKILRICKVLDMEELFYLFHTILCKVCLLYTSLYAKSALPCL